jgi:alpha-L-fucosidase
MKHITIPLVLIIGLIMIGCSSVQVPATPEKAPLPLEERRASTETMEKWNDWKFGLFVHWGPWSQTEIGAIWKIVKTDTPEEREQRFELYKTFDPVNFDPQEWAQVAKDAGMKYMVFTTKHHDGFCNFETDVTDFKITNPDCPHSRQANPDITGELVKAFREEGMGIGHYYSHIDWYHPQGKYFSKRHWEYDESRIDSDPESWKKFVRFEKTQVQELMTQYGDIDIMWFDIRWPGSTRNDNGIHHRVKHPIVKEDVIDMVTMMRDLHPGLIINDRGVHSYGDFATPEQKIPKDAPEGYWETNMTVSDPNRRKAGGFWYKGSDALYKSQEELLRVMAEVFSKGGNFLLNVGPQPDGKIPAGEVDALKGIGDWLEVNGEAVYGSKRSPLSIVPEWGFITRKANTLYLYVFNWPGEGEKITLGVSNKVLNVSLLGSDYQVKTETSEAGINISLPTEKLHPVVSVLAVELDGSPVELMP